MRKTLLTVEIRQERDVVLARQRARHLAELLGLDLRERTGVATAVSEIARNAYQYAGGGRVLFQIDGKAAPSLVVEVSDHGPGISDPQAILEGRYTSPTGMGLGLVGARRLMDRFELDSAPGRGTTVTLWKHHPSRSLPLTPRDFARIADELVRGGSQGPLEEVQQQNQELLCALEDLRARQVEVERLNGALEQANHTLDATNQELAETNRGMLVLYAELDDKAEQLRLASELKSRFLSYMSHEFRTPLGSILRLSQLLLDRLDGDLTSEQEIQVGMIRRSTESLLELVSDLLDLAKIEAGKTTIHPDHFQVENVLAGLRGMFRPLFATGAVGLVVEEPDTLPWLFTDEGKVTQILRNFLSNALKFTQQGEVRVSTALQPDGTIAFSVVDTGLGIPPEAQGRIFEEFAQVDSSVQRKVRGTGLGLPLSRRLAELLGGHITLVSEPGKGSTFTLVIPPVCPDCGDEPEPGVAGERGSPAPPVTVLIIDDDDAARASLREAITALPATIVEATSGREGLIMAREGLVDLILLDLVMPDLSGYEVLEELKNDPSTARIPVVVATSKPIDEVDRGRLRDSFALLSKGTVGADVVVAAARGALREAREEGFGTSSGS